jgi:penicillin-binding protein 1B
MAGDQRNVFQKLFGIGKETTVAPAGAPVNGMPALPAQPTGAQAAAATGQPGPAPPPPDEQKKKKRGFFAKLFGKGGDDNNKQQQADPSQPH